MPGVASSSPDRAIRAFGGAVLSMYSSVSGTELWFTDGTAAGTHLIVDLMTGGSSSSPMELAVVGGRVFYRAASNFGNELHMSDGTALGTMLVTDIATTYADSNPLYFTPTSNGVVFSATDGLVAELYHSDGTSAGTYPLDYGVGGNYIYEMTGDGSVAYLSGYAPSVGYELLRTDGTQAGSVALDINPSGGSDPEHMAWIGGRLWFGARVGTTGLEPKVSDGTAAGTISLGDFSPGSSSSAPNYFTACGPNLVVFSLYDPTAGREPWVSDGTPAGTQRLLDVAAGSGGSDPDNFLAVGNLVYFVAYSVAAGRELWVTDGTPAGTHLVVDLYPGASGAAPRQLVRLQNGTVLFAANVPGAGIEICRTDGTAAGTVLVGQVVASSSSGSIENLVAVGNLAFFTADDGVSGRELWVTDGTTVSRVMDIYPGAPNGVLSGTLRARAGSGSVIFAGSDGTQGLQIWVSDGTAAGTHQVGKIGPWAGSGAVDLGSFTEIGSETWFWCDDGITGKEPWRITLSGPVASVATYGAGCRGTGNIIPAISAIGLPQLGNAGFGFGLTAARPTSFAVLNVSFLPGNAPLGGGCSLLLGQPIVSLPGVLSSSTGTASTLLPIPSDPSFGGLSLNGQWLVFDPNGWLLNFACLSNALNLRIGN